MAIIIFSRISRINAILIVILVSIYDFGKMLHTGAIIGCGQKDNLLIRGWPTPRRKDPPMRLKVWILNIDVAVRSCLYSLLEMILYI